MAIPSERSQRTSLTREEVLAGVREVLGEVLGVRSDTIEEHQHLVNDLGADSLAITEIAIETEDRFGLRVPDDFAEKAPTVGAVVDGVLRLMEEGRGR
jgi:acyl carrier protein